MRNNNIPICGYLKPTPEQLAAAAAEEAQIIADAGGMEAIRAEFLAELALAWDEDEAEEKRGHR